MRNGFTLIELSIVLVIIGLIVGGVLVGRDLIHAAEIRATVSQVEKYNSAVNTFRSKYNCLPGDCANASNFGFDPISNGNGDDIIGECSAASCFNINSQESTNFWYHLERAGLIPNQPSVIQPELTPIAAGPGQPGISSPKLRMPQAKGAFLGGWAVGADAPFTAAFGGGSLAGHNFVIASAQTVIYYTNFGIYIPADIYVLDAKMDDGFPLSGTVRGFNASSSLVRKFGDFTGLGMQGIGAGGANANVCIANDVSPAQYNILHTSTDDDGGLCSAVIKAAF